MWIIALVVLAVGWLVLSLCKAAARGDRYMERDWLDRAWRDELRKGERDV